MSAGASTADLEERYLGLLLQAPTPICVTRGPEHRVELCNPAFDSVSSAGEKLGQPFRVAHGRPDTLEHVAAMDRVFVSGERFLAAERQAQPAEPVPRGAHRYFNFVYEPLRDRRATVDGIMVMALEVTAEVESRRALEEVQRRSRFLVSATAALAESLDYQRTLRRVAELAVPDIADWCTVTAVDEQGELRRLAVVHTDPSKRSLVAEYERKFPPTEHRGGQMVDVLRRGSAALKVRVTDADLVRAAQTADHLRVLRGLGCTSCILVPMIARGETLGVISLMRADPARPYGELELAIAEELAHRAALAVDSARLYRQARRREEAMRFFADASVILSSSLDSTSICERLARLVVPSFADWCGVDLVVAGELQSQAIAHVDPTKVELAREMRRKFSPDPAAPRGPASVARTGRSELVDELTDEMLVRGARDPEHLRYVRDLGLRSVLLVPLVAGGRPIGVLNLVWAESGRRYGPDDVEVMEELGRRAGVAVENARLYDEARVAVQLRDDFLSMASHELKTPLTSMRLKVDGILRAASRANERAVDLGRLAARMEGVDKQLKRLTELVDSLLDVSRAADGRLALELEDVDLVAVVGDVALRLKDDLANAGCSLSFVVSGTGGGKRAVVGRWDRLRLEEIVTNFLSNAIKYGGGKPIQVRVSSTDGSATLEVEDHGIGISPSDQERLFHRFARAASAEHYGGFGLGLWIVKVLAEAMGGEVGVESAVGQGSVFRVKLPRRGG
jgi:signal transduction histidine kinase